MHYIVPNCKNIVEKIKKINKPQEKICFEANISLETLNKFYNNDYFKITFGELFSLLNYLNCNILDFILPNFVFTGNITDDSINLYNALINTKI